MCITSLSVCLNYDERRNTHIIDSNNCDSNQLNNTFVIKPVVHTEMPILTVPISSLLLKAKEANVQLLILLVMPAVRVICLSLFLKLVP